MTGRKGRVVQTEDGIQYESRSEVDVPLETLNLTGDFTIYCFIMSILYKMIININEMFEMQFHLL